MSFCFVSFCLFFYCVRLLPKKIQLEREQRFGVNFVLLPAFSPVLKTVTSTWWIRNK